MKILIDKQNKAVIATGWYKGKKIRAVAVCHKEDTFDIDFGVELVKKKYKIKQTYVKMNIHESNAKRLLGLWDWIVKEVLSENKIIISLDSKILKDSDDCEKFIKSKYNK